MANPHLRDAPLPGGRQEPVCSTEDTVDVVAVQRAALRRFVAAQLGSEAEADVFLRNSLARALKHNDALPRRERIIPWFYRILHRTVADHLREMRNPGARTDLTSVSGGAQPLADHNGEWTAAVTACLEGLLPSLKPRYAEIIRRVGLKGEMKLVVAHDLKMSRGAFDVALHRARKALLRRLTILCGTVSFDLTRAMPGMPMQSGGEVLPAGQPGRYRVRVKPEMSGDWNARLRYDGPRGQGAVSFNVKVN